MKSSTYKDKIWMPVGLMLMAGIWQVLSLYYGQLILPSPGETLTALGRLFKSGQLWSQAGPTLLRGLTGFCLAAVLGTGLGLAVGFCKRLESALRPALVAIQTVPLVSWLLLAMVWFGFTGSVPVFVVFITTFPLVVINVYHGVSGMRPEFTEMARVFGVKRAVIIREIYYPQLLPFLLAGFSTALGTTWKAVAMAELLSARTGVGAGMSIARSNLETADILAWTLVLVALGLISDRLLYYLAGRKMAALDKSRVEGRAL